ncbi:MAG TPA: hypothetical protein VHY09_10530 [Candidatus Methylacidiphilales bacterium]|jgi:hypothetical protein|nr:hypothetical protein [Candidatus Methylacidiphilales bacterium]
MSSPVSPQPSPGTDEPIPPIDPQLQVPTILGNGALFKFGVNGGDLDKVFSFYQEELRKRPDNAACQVDLALLHLLLQRKDEAYRVQSRALERQRLFRVVGTAGKVVPVRRRVLALVAPGDFTNNAQLEFILDGGDVGLDVLYLVPGLPLPAALPEHDVAFCAVNESDENLPVLQRLAALVPRWPRPVLNAPERIARLSRNGVATLLRAAPSVCAPAVRRITSSDLQSVAEGAVDLGDLLPEASFPILVRPVGSHGGKNLAKIDDGPALASYLEGVAGSVSDFFIAPFVDYRGADGLFRKYRVVFFEGEPFLCHLALSTHWMIHYLNAGMAEDEVKRAEEERAMETFESDFARRHRNALRAVAARLGLDYVVIDCSELPDGRLLLFEADIAMVIHSIDPPAIFPYKQGHMAKVFDAFRAMIDRAAARPPGIE